MDGFQIYHGTSNPLWALGYLALYYLLAAISCGIYLAYLNWQCTGADKEAQSTEYKNNIGSKESESNSPARPAKKSPQNEQARPKKNNIVSKESESNSPARPAKKSPQNEQARPKRNRQIPSKFQEFELNKIPGDLKRMNKPRKTNDQDLQMRFGNMGKNKNQPEVKRTKSLDFLGCTDAFTEVYSKVTVPILQEPSLIGILKCQTKTKDASVKAPHTRAKAKLAQRIRFDETYNQVRYF